MIRVKEKGNRPSVWIQSVFEEGEASLENLPVPVEGSQFTVADARRYAAGDE